MAAAMQVFVRYDTLNDEFKNSQGEIITRRARYETMEGIDKPPELYIPEIGMYMWNWYSEINGSIGRIIDGVCRPIPPSEFLAWSMLTGNTLRAHEYEILRALDDAYCSETNKELQAKRNKDAEAQKRDVQSGRSRRARR